MSCVSAWFKAGKRYDSETKPGVAHVCEHIIGAPYKNNSVWAGEEELSTYGILSEPWIDYSRFRITHTQNTENTLKSLQILTNQISNPKLEKEVFEKEKNSIKNEVREYTNIYNRIWELAHEGLWPNTSLGRPMSDTKEQVDAITLKDVKKFYEENYVTADSLFVVMSPHSSKEISECLEMELKDKKTADYARAVNNVTEDPEKIMLENWNTEDITIGIAFKTVPMSKFLETAKLDLVLAILAGSNVSRLLQSLRHDADLTYWVHAKTDSYEDTGYIMPYMSVEIGKHNQALGLIYDEIKKLKKVSIVKPELDMHRNNYISRLLSDKESVKDKAIWYGNQIDTGNDEFLSLQKYIEMLGKITPEDIQKTARKFLTDNNVSIGIIGPLNEEDIEVPSLG